jgi:hypothetical protein
MLIKTEFRYLTANTVCYNNFCLILLSQNRLRKRLMNIINLLICMIWWLSLMYITVKLELFANLSIFIKSSFNSNRVFIKIFKVKNYFSKYWKIDNIIISGICVIGFVIDNSTHICELWNIVSNSSGEIPKKYR